MDTITPLPSYMVARYLDWRATQYSDQSAGYRKLADEGQKPRTLIISCCDSRVQPTDIFESDPGEFFVHRNIANLVPPFQTDGAPHGTSAVLEYAVTALKVQHIVVMGHSQCGGVQGCVDMCTGKAPQLEQGDSFVGRWIDFIRPGFDRVAAKHTGSDLAPALEKEAVLVSLENLMTFPFVKTAFDAGALTLHGLWNDIGTGAVHAYDPATGAFAPL